MLGAGLRVGAGGVPQLAPRCRSAAVRRVPRAHGMWDEPHVGKCGGGGGPGAVADDMGG